MKLTVLSRRRPVHMPGSKAWFRPPKIDSVFECSRTGFVTYGPRHVIQEWARNSCLWVAGTPSAAYCDSTFNFESCRFFWIKPNICFPSCRRWYFCTIRYFGSWPDPTSRVTNISVYFLNIAILWTLPSCLLIVATISCLIAPIWLSIALLLSSNAAWHDGEGRWLKHTKLG